MWADTLLDLERGHLLRLMLWGAASMLSGTILLLFITWRAAQAPLLRHFAIQAAAWGALELAFCAWSWPRLSFRDFAGLQRLLNLLWLNAGLDVGYVAAGATLMFAAWRFARRHGAMGAGLGVIVQGLALLMLDLRLIGAIGPLR